MRLSDKNIVLMSTTAENNKRIAKNTLLLYFRMLLTMVVSLYTSRVVLNALGVEDYGIYNVVGGVVAMFSVLSGSLSAAISRFITFELGRNDMEKLKRVFSSAVTIQIGLALIIILLAETLGLWFLNEKMNIPLERMTAANWVFQFSILTFTINLVSVPYNAAIIAHEKMSAFAYISILEVFGKLIVAYIITISLIDKLVFYGLLLMLIAMVVRFVYGCYCKKHFEECKYRFVYDKLLFKEMFSFAGWNFIGASSDIFRNQGTDILINLFFGPVVNASRGISVQVSHAVSSFATNFITALKPQITKNYALGNMDYMLTLVYKGAKFSFFIMLLIVVPIYATTPYLLNLWLGQVPDHSVNFVRLILLFTMNETMAGPLITAMLATGKIRNYQLIVGGSQLLNLPISYICLKIGLMVESVFVVAIMVSCLGMLLRLYMLRNMIGLSMSYFLRHVYFLSILVLFLSMIVPFILSSVIEYNLYNFISIVLTSVFTTSIVIFIIGCNSSEKKIICNQIRKIHYKFRK